jgi:hypothetical protein
MSKKTETTPAVTKYKTLMFTEGSVKVEECVTKEILKKGNTGDKGTNQQS